MIWHRLLNFKPGINDYQPLIIIASSFTSILNKTKYTTQIPSYISILNKIKYTIQISNYKLNETKHIMHISSYTYILSKLNIHHKYKKDFTWDYQCLTTETELLILSCFSKEI